MTQFRARRGLVVLAIAAQIFVPGCGPIASPDVAASSSSAPISGPSSPEISTPTNKTPNRVGAGDWEMIGSTVQGRPIRVRSFGHGPRRVLFIGGIHGDEAEGAYSTAQLPEAFAAAGLADVATLTILEDANPDGRAAGTRTNANGVDINRNFPAKNFDTTNPLYGSSPLSQPESRAVYDAIDRVRPDLVVVAHSWVGRQFLNYDGPARALAEQFSTLSGLEVEESTSFAPTPGSLGSYVGRDRGIPILTIEVLKGSSPEAVWGKIRKALLRVIEG